MVVFLASRAHKGIQIRLTQIRTLGQENLVMLEAPVMLEVPVIPVVSTGMGQI
jgi:hypothetical protein